MMLPFEVEELEETPQTEHIEYSREQPKKKHPGRIALPDHLPVEEIVLEPKEDITGWNAWANKLPINWNLLSQTVYQTIYSTQIHSKLRRWSIQ